MPTSLVIGSNRGIGLELCRQLANRGHSVVATCREPSPALSELGVRVETGVDVTSDAACGALASRLAGTSIDGLWLSAGILGHEPPIQALDIAGVERQLAVNAVGPLRVVRAVLGLIASGGKIAILTSLMGSLGDNGTGGYYGYRMSKAAAREWETAPLVKGLRPQASGLSQSPEMRNGKLEIGNWKFPDPDCLWA